MEVAWNGSEHVMAEYYGLHFIVDNKGGSFRLSNCLTCQLLNRSLPIRNNDIGLGDVRGDTSNPNPIGLYSGSHLLNCRLLYAFKY